MIDSLTALAVLALQAATIQPASVPAKGTQSAVIHLDQAGMVHLAAESGSGTACELVDHLRGPFAESGKAGRTNCRLDLLLDAGDYQLRLSSAAKGKGKVKLSAVAFEEVNRPLVRLENHRSDLQTVHPGQQASYWLHLDRGGPIDLLVMGRTAGQVELWRAGAWVEASNLQDVTRHLKPGIDLHQWVGQPILEAGDYLLVVYGVDAIPVTAGAPLDTVDVRYGFEAGPSERTITLTLGPLGFAAFELPASPQLATMSRLSPSTVATTLELFDEDEQGLRGGRAGTCSIDPKGTYTDCLATAHGKFGHVVSVTGEPGTRVVLAWGRSGYSPLDDGDYTQSDTLSFDAPTSGLYRVATHDLHVDVDSAPLGCLLENVPSYGDPWVVAYDFLPVSAEHPLSRSFNFQGSSETVTFAVTQTQPYRIATSGGIIDSCELFRFEGEQLVSVAPREKDTKTCLLKPLLSEGHYELRLYGSTSGIEKLVIAKGSHDPAPTPGKTSCQFPAVSLQAGQHYRVSVTRKGDIGARGLVLRPLPLPLTSPLPIHLEAGDSVELSLADADALRVTGPPSASFTCTRGSTPGALHEGTCDFPSGAGGALVLKNTGAGPLDLIALHPRPVVPPPALVPYTPHLETPLEIAEGVPLLLDFDRLGTHSALLNVKQAGLYDVATEGLLATACSLRTPIVATVAHDQSGGRGRNCLVSTYLREGRYLVTVSTVGASRGRGAIRVSRRAVRESASLRADGETFVRVGANELVKQRLVIRRSGDYTLSTTALGGALQCRLEDAHGWPVVAAPTSCTGSHHLVKGSYLWMQLPLTVPSSRHTQLARIVPEKPLTGAKPHEVALNTPYDVRLSKKGEDTFHFATEADLDVHVALSNAMQGRLYVLAADGTKTAVEFIPPDLVPNTAEPTPDDVPSDGAAPDAAPADDTPSPDDGADDARPMHQYEDQGEGEGESPQPAPVPDEPAIAATPTAPPPARPQVPTGMQIHLPAGRYELVTQHSRGDVNILYRLQLGVDSLAPGVHLVVNAPARIPLHVAHDGILRLGTSGETDVRCRIFDAEGRLVQESSENGDDWNCALAEPFRAGEYEVVIESETQVPGVTTVAVSMPAAADLGGLADGKQFKVGSTAASATLPAEAATGLQEVFLRSKSRFSCALTGADGKVLHEETGVSICGFLRAAGGQPARLDVWTLDRPADITASLRVRPIAERSGSTLAAGTAVRAMLPRAGRYSTSTGILCLPADQAGVLQPCGPEVSLPAGPAIFALLGSADAKLPLDEQIDRLDAPVSASVALTSQSALKRLKSDRGLHLIAARAAAGEKAGPVCQLEGGVSAIAERSCFAASGVTESSLLSLRSGSADPINAALDLRAVPYPSAASPLVLGRSELALETTGAARFTPPAGTWRIELTVAPQSWVVEIDSKGAAADLCPPQSALSACELEGAGGELVVFSPESPHLEVLTQALDAPSPTLALTTRFERRAGLPGTERLRIAFSDTERLVDVEGARRCQVRLDDGTHFDTCTATIPAHQGALLRIDHEAGAVRATVHGPSDLSTARFGPLVAAGATSPALATATFVTLAGERVDRTFTLDHEAIVHLVSTGGVCALAQGATLLAEAGLDSGCDLYRVVHPGTYQLHVRRFGDAPLAGQVAWTAVDVSELADGVGVERWLAPGERRYFHFRTASAGQVGVGMQAAADVLDCAVFGADQKPLGTGCQEFLSLPAGDYLLSVQAPAHGTALRFHPVVLGLTGAAMDVPQDYLLEFFARVGAQP